MEQLNRKGQLLCPFLAVLICFYEKIPQGLVQILKKKYKIEQSEYEAHWSFVTRSYLSHNFLYFTSDVSFKIGKVLRIRF